jgi:ferredoxin-type protein NapH
MRQKIRRILIYISLLLFPITLNFFSPYVSVDGAFRGVLAGSVMLFAIMFLSSLFIGRLWCSWICPMAGLSEIGMTINSNNVAVIKLRTLRYSIFAIWFSVLVCGFIFAGGIKEVNPLYLTESGISVDQPIKYVIYYGVLAIFFALTLILGKRGACHAICWMSPFLVVGTKIGRVLHAPQLLIKTEVKKCIDCKKCDKKCPMSILVSSDVKSGHIKSFDCILCGECIDACPKKVLDYDLCHKISSKRS